MNSHVKLDLDPVLRARPPAPLCVDPKESIRAAMNALRDACRGCLLVCRDNRMFGIFTERDALRLMATDTDYDQPIESVMHAPVVTVDYHESVGTAISRMLDGGHRRLPVLNDAGEPIAVLTVKTILRYLVEHFPSVVYTLPPEPHYVTHVREGA